MNFLSNLFKSNWGKWIPWSLSVHDPSHKECYQASDDLYGVCELVPEYKTDLREVSLNLRRINKKSGVIEFSKHFVGRYHKDNIPSFEQLVSMLKLETFE